jgi:nicotinate-nucleotide adenylyltransferase
MIAPLFNPTPLAPVRPAFPRVVNAKPLAFPRFGTLSDFQKNNAVYGGGFDPLHNQHANVVRAAKKLGIKRLFLIPTWVAPHKVSQNSAPFDDRVEMLKQTFVQEPNLDVQVLDIEKKLPAPSYSLQTLRALFPGFDSFHTTPEKRVPFLIGEDVNPRMWRGAEDLLKNTLFLLTPRPGFPAKRPDSTEEAPKEPKLHTIPLPVEGHSLSSRDIRQAIADGLSMTELRKLVPERVARYIAEKGLYGFQSGSRLDETV